MKPGAVRLKVANLDRQHAFYERAIGLHSVDPSNGFARLGADGTTVVELVESPDAGPRPPHTTGLFHLAILVPDRGELAAALVRVTQAGWRLTGASDHLVSEALYLNDLEGNGIEIYRDRPRSEWRYADGSIQMSTLPLDLRDLLGELERIQRDAGGMPAATRIGHVHLNVADLADAEAFYSGALGFDVTVRGYPGALFLSTGGYHHHIGVNTWAGEGAPPPAGSRGLRWFDVELPGPDDVHAAGDRLEQAGFDPVRDGDTVRVADPSGNGV